jgi:hypothetical protein
VLITHHRNAYPIGRTGIYAAGSASGRAGIGVVGIAQANLVFQDAGVVITGFAGVKTLALAG